MTRPLKLTGVEGERPGEAGGSGEGGAVDVVAWLEVVARLSGLPEGERGQVRDELGDHIEGRVRDLMLTGRGEREATAEAIGELGDAAELARNLRAARRRPQRRRLMATMIGAAMAAAAGLGLAALAWQPGGHPAPASTYEPPAAAGLAEAGKARVSLAQGARWCDFFEAAGKASGHPVVVHWSSLEGPGAPETRAINREGDLGLEVASLPLGAAMGLVNDARNLSGDARVDWRLMEGTLVFATQGYFDRAEMVLKTYDLSAVEGASGEEGVEKLVELIKTTAEPDAWSDRGGAATAAAYGTKLFVKAPPRLHSGVAWMLGELRAVEGRAEGRAEGAGGAGVQTRAFALQRVEAGQAAEVVRAMFKGARAGGRAATITVDPRTNSVVAAGTPEALMMVEGCLAGMDQGAAAEGQKTRTFALKHLGAGEAMRIAQSMMTKELRGKLDRATTEAETNSLAATGTAEALEALEKALGRADQEAGARQGGEGAAAGAAGGAEGGAEGIPAAVLENIGPGEVVRLRHAEAGELAPVVARRMVAWSREAGNEPFVVTAQGDGVLVAGSPTARARAAAMLRELDQTLARAGAGAMDGGYATLSGVRRMEVPVLSEVPVLGAMFRGEARAGIVIRSEGGLLRVTGPDGSSLETSEIRVSPAGESVR